MRIAVLFPLRGRPSQGVEKYNTEIVPRLSQQREVEELSIICPPAVSDWASQFGVEVHVVSDTDVRSGFRGIGKLVEENKFDVALSATPRRVWMKGIPIVPVVQNVEPVEKPIYPMPVMWRARLQMLRLEYRLACRQATRVIAVSQHTKDRLCQRLSLSPDSVDVVYHGYRVETEVSSKKPNIAVAENDFLFGAGNIVPYRGYEDILLSLAKLRTSSSLRPTLVLAGSAHGYPVAYDRRLKKLSGELGIEGQVIWAGHLSKEEMLWCYQHCRLFVQASRAEACPSILLEAMGNGCICVSCDHPPMPEISHKAALYYRIGDADDLADKIARVYSMPQGESLAWRTASKERASWFTWDRALEGIVATLRCTLNGNANPSHHADFPA